MGLMLEELRAYLVKAGVALPIYLEWLPEDDTPAVQLVEYAADRVAGYGLWTRRVKVTVRHVGNREALITCGEISRLLDSGDEELIRLSEGRSAIIRPRRLPVFVRRAVVGTVTYAFSVAVQTFAD